MYMCCFLISPFWLFCDPMDYSPPGFSVCGTEWDAFFFSRGSPQSKNQTHVSCIGRQILYYWVHIYMFMYVYMYMYMWHTHIHTNEELILWNWCWRRLSKLPWTARRSNQSILMEPWTVTGKTDAEAPILWPLDAQSWLIGKEPDAGND